MPLKIAVLPLDISQYLCYLLSMYVKSSTYWFRYSWLRVELIHSVLTPRQAFAQRRRARVWEENTVRNVHASKLQAFARRNRARAGWGGVKRVLCTRFTPPHPAGECRRHEQAMAQESRHMLKRGTITLDKTARSDYNGLVRSFSYITTFIELSERYRTVPMGPAYDHNQSIASRSLSRGQHRCKFGLRVLDDTLCLLHR